MRLVSFNILHGESRYDGRVDTERLTTILTWLNADVLALQEVDRGQARSGRSDQAAAVARAVGASSWRFAPAVQADIEARYRHGAHSLVPSWAVSSPGLGDATAPVDLAGSSAPGYGIALLSRHPVTRWHGLDLPTFPLHRRISSWAQDRHVASLADQPRVALAAEVATSSGPLLVATTHLTADKRWCPVQFERLISWLEAFDLPVVLLGDLNMVAPLDGGPARWRPLIQGPTFPSSRPFYQFDHVLAWGAVPPVVRGAIRRLPISDHAAIEVELATSAGGRAPR